LRHDVPDKSGKAGVSAAQKGTPTDCDECAGNFGIEKEQAIDRGVQRLLAVDERAGMIDIGREGLLRRRLFSTGARFAETLAHRRPFANTRVHQPVFVSPLS
jgi:hypothetical protein